MEPTADTFEASIAHRSSVTVVGPDRVSVPELHPGDTLGRHVIARELGRGAMGVVYAALDPKLGREVALKLLRGQQNEARQQELILEAQALAAVKHPNVLTVHEVGSSATGATFISMELIEGQTLRDWLAVKPRSVTQLRQVFAAAARGLFAAHEAHLVHGDFKPENVMIDANEHVIVLDFGLARADDGEQTPRSMGGTRVYMAPEVLARLSPNSPRSDQFSLCVALWEALFGERPFARGDMIEGPPDRPPLGKRLRLPRVLHRAMLRGLSLQPDARFDSLTPIIEALEYRAPRGRWLIGLGLVACAGLGIRAGLEERTRAQTLAACELAGDALSEHWNEDVRTQIATRFEQTGELYAADAGRRADALLDTWASSWTEKRTQLCVESKLHGAWRSTDAVTARDCFAMREAEFSALLEIYMEADASQIPSAVPLASRLSDPARCLDRRRLTHQLTPADEDTRAKVQDLRIRSIRVSTLIKAGRGSEAKRASEALVEEARALAWPPILAETLHTLAGSRHYDGEHAQARALHDEAFFLAIGVGHDELAARAATSIIGLLVQLSDLEAVSFWAPMSTKLMARIDLDGSVEEAGLLLNLGSLYTDKGDHEKALAALEHSAKLYELNLGKDHPDLGMALTNLGAEMRAMGSGLEATPVYEQAYEVFLAGYGPDHPMVGMALINLASSQKNLGQFEQSLESLARAQELLTRAFGGDDVRVTTAMNNRAIGYQRLGRLDEARALLERSLAIRVAADPNHPRVASALSNLAETHYLLGDYEKSLDYSQRALALRRETLGERHSAVAVSHYRTGRALFSLGRLEPALAALQLALELCEETGAPNRSRFGQVLYQLARVELALGLGPDARAHLEQALVLPVLETQPERYGVRFELAHLDLDSPDSERAHAALQALTELERELSTLEHSDDPGGVERKRLPELRALLAAKAPAP